MKAIYKILILLLICLNTYAETDCSVVTEIPQLECESLLQFYQSTNGDNWKYNNGWNATNKPCDWFGITCKNNSIIEIDLENYRDNNNLTGTIPDFNGLPNLQVLILTNNLLTGEIPDFSNLPNLQILNISKNQLVGKIPNFTNLPNLQELYTGGNQLTSITDCAAVTEIPQLECESLVQFYYSTEGPNWGNDDNAYIKDWNVTNMPCSWSGITCENNSVTEIMSAFNQLNGPIPNFNNLPNLKTLLLISNQLKGSIPNFSNLSNLQGMFISNIGGEQ